MKATLQPDCQSVCCQDSLPHVYPMWLLSPRLAECDVKRVAKKKKRIQMRRLESRKRTVVSVNECEKTLYVVVIMGASRSFITSTPAYELQLSGELVQHWLYVKL